MSRSLSHTDLVSQLQVGSAERTPSIRGSNDTRRSSSENVALHSIQFGKPSQSSSKPSSSSGNEWTNLLKHTASGGIASALSGGLGSIGGIGSLITGIMHLFGGGGKKRTPPPLVEFHLPASQQQTLTVSSKGSSVHQGSVAEATSVRTPGFGIYGNASQLHTSGSSPSTQWIQEQSGQIAEAVKNALLNSSSLNDVIGEL
ncbi:MAG: hypothetical protein ACR2IV_12850 [Bryobacteraceae bacterium]